MSESVGGCNCAKSTVNSVMLVLKPANFLPTPTRLVRGDCLRKLEAALVLSFRFAVGWRRQEMIARRGGFRFCRDVEDSVFGGVKKGNEGSERVQQQDGRRGSNG